MPFPERINEGKGPPPEWAASPNRHPGKERSRRNQCHGWPPLLHAGQYVCSSVLATAAATTATSSSTNIRLPLLQPSNMDRRPATLPSEPDRACWGTQLHGLNTDRVLSPSSRQAAPAGPLRSYPGSLSIAYRKVGAKTPCPCDEPEPCVSLAFGTGYVEGMRKSPEYYQQSLVGPSCKTPEDQRTERNAGRGGQRVQFEGNKDSDGSRVTGICVSSSKDSSCIALVS